MHTAQLAGMYVVAVAQSVLLARLLLLGLNRRGHYPFFSAFLAADLTQTVAVICSPYSPKSTVFFWFWVYSEMVLVALQILAAREVWTRIRASYPGIGRLGKELIEWVFILALLVSVASLFFDVLRANWSWVAWSGALVLRRAFVSVLALTVGSLAYGISWAPEPIGPNLKRHARIFAGYLTTSALFSLLVASRLLTPPTASRFKLAASAMWFICWIGAFRRGQEEARIEKIASDENLDEALHRLKHLADELGHVSSGLSDTTTNGVEH
jgi:hypothetical protein